MLLGYAAGVVLQPPTGTVGSVAALAALLAAVTTWRARMPRPRVGWGLVVVPALCLGILGRSGGVVPCFPEAPAAVEGWMASPPESRPWGDSAWLQVESLRAEDDSLRGTTAAARRIRVHARGRLPPYGTRCRVVGTLRPGKGPRNFDGFDERGVLVAHDAAAVLVAQRWEPLPGRRGPAWRREVIEPLRRLLAQRMARTLAPSEASLLMALVLGMDARIDPTLHETWRALGLAHILAVSGMHVGILASAILTWVGPPRRRRALLLLLGGVGIYAVLGGLAPSVLRASLMTAWAALAVALGRPLSSVLALALASITLLLGAPSLRFDLGFQLSCAATLGIVVWARPLQALVQRARCVVVIGRPLAFCLGSAGISLAAQLATLPLVLWKFGYLSRVGLLANLSIVPLANGALVLGLAGAPWALVAPALCRSFWLLAGALLHGAVRASQAISALGEPRWFVPTSAEMLVLAFLAALAALLAGALGTQRRRRAGIACLALLLVCLLGAGTVLWIQRPPRWRLEALDVGQGDALLLRVGEQAWLVDAGDALPRNRGAQVILPHLRRAGIARLRGMILTHPHLDHMGGALAVLQGMAVDTLYMAAVSRHARHYAALLETSVPRRWLRAGEQLHLGPRYTARVLWPQSTDPLGSGANGESLVLWARGDGNPQWLAMGDLEADGEAALLELHGAELRAAAPQFLVLKAGHHGSRTSSTPEFLDHIGADVALLCVGAHNRYGHPAPATLRALEARHCRVLRTDQGGAIRLERRGETLWLERPGVAPTLFLRPPPTQNDSITPPSGTIDAPPRGS